MNPGLVASKYTRRQINQDRMIFGDFSVKWKSQKEKIMVFQNGSMSLLYKQADTAFWLCRTDEPDGPLSQQTRGIHPMLLQCWASVEDGGPTLKQHWVNAPCLLGASWWKSKRLLISRWKISAIFWPFKGYCHSKCNQNIHLSTSNIKSEVFFWKWHRHLSTK